MSFIRRKVFGSRVYLYRVENRRIGKKVVQKVVKYLGKEVKSVHGNAKLFVRKLSRKEEKELTKIKNSRDSKLRDRAYIILLSSQRNTVKQIAEKLGMNYLSVRLWVQRFNGSGIDGLESKKAKGAEPKFTKKEIAEILQIATTEPKMLGLHFTTWSLPKLKRYVTSKGIVDNIATESIRTILKKEGIKLRKGKRWQYSNDPEFSKKNSL